ncbi:MAG: RluA family pseudouridine synthase [Tepidisphaeraceae bacterium]|jgi:23S rRNA pseudouridine1911/1915/1917 synthase
MPLLLHWLVKKLPAAKRQNLKRMVEAGRVLVNGVAARKLKQEIAETDEITLIERGTRPTPALAPLLLIHEDDDVIVVNKPSGLLTSTVPDERRPTAIRILRNYAGQHHITGRVGVIHRLDREVSGLLVFSKNHETFAALKAQFVKHTVHRVYTAIVHGKPDPAAGKVDNFLVEYADGTAHVTKDRKKGENAITEYKVIRSEPGRSWVRITLHTGKKHQIRCHMASINCPILGDSVYGNRDGVERLMLAATELEFDHPRTGKRMCFTIEPPEEFGKIMKELPTKELPTKDTKH